MGDEYISLARVLKTQGRRGEVAVEVHTDIPDRFLEGMRLFALDPQGTVVTVHRDDGVSPDAQVVTHDRRPVADHAVRRGAPAVPAGRR